MPFFENLILGFSTSVSIYDKASKTASLAG
ncbi:hypothetical protein SAMN05444146_2380 [Flavobacterium johnsoniae]|uniref:Uncharacterized protein n=1 Tax=Flavobacterium johnsoniae TaxID=986 RepID=A0A1M6WH41_FLAJO|nr:hypothetical protein SAMN05444388_102654 [Flavobacterium johnsoniae]SHK93092.1 hypothetical protein SAMN05444146_2380 [Flavobacterium johnsoniae]